MVNNHMKRIDERKTMFARMNYKVGSREYDDYYKNNMEQKNKDDELRELPNIGGEGTATYHPVHSPLADAGFGFLADIKHLASGSVNPKKAIIDPVEATEKLKKFARYFGASLVGITEMKEDHYYSHRGRQPENYGEPVNEFHKFGLVFAVEMDKEMINRAPQMEEMIEVTKGYVSAAIIGMWLSYYIRELGYDARNHMDGNYLVVAPLVAQDAGLGEIGRTGILITKPFGSRVRLGVVTTDMPLVADEFSGFGIPEFCEICGKCVKTCPGKAIPSGDRKMIDGVLRWQIIQESCYGMWRRLGTDCGICISACPFSQEIPQEQIDRMKGSPDTMKKILKEHEEKHGIRPYTRQPLDILK
jgi:ferredoxin